MANNSNTETTLNTGVTIKIDPEEAKKICEDIAHTDGENCSNGCKNLTPEAAKKACISACGNIYNSSYKNCCLEKTGSETCEDDSSSGGSNGGGSTDNDDSNNKSCSGEIYTNFQSCLNTAKAAAHDSYCSVHPYDDNEAKSAYNIVLRDCCKGGVGCGSCSSPTPSYSTTCTSYGS